MEGDLSWAPEHRGDSDSKESDCFFLFVCLFVWLCWVFVAVRGLSLVAASRGYSSLRCTGFSLWWLLLLQSTGSREQAQ